MGDIEPQMGQWKSHTEISRRDFINAASKAAVGVVIAGSLVELVAACGNDAAALAVPGPYDVFIVGGKFMPPKISIKLNDTVTWTNNDSKVHTIVSDNNLFKQMLQPGGTFSFTFSEHNNYHYHDLAKPSMNGLVFVEQNPAASCNDCHG